MKSIYCIEYTRSERAAYRPTTFRASTSDTPWIFATLPFAESETGVERQVVATIGRRMSEFSEYQVTNLTSSGRIIIINSDKVYDVTDFADRHPGGREYLEKHAGRDVTQVMKSEDPHSHSGAAYSILRNYCIGYLKQVIRRVINAVSYSYNV